MSKPLVYGQNDTMYMVDKRGKLYYTKTYIDPDTFLQKTEKFFLKDEYNLMDRVVYPNGKVTIKLPT